MAKAVNLSGQQFGYLRVIERDYEAQELHKKERQAWWKCECLACGKIKSFRSSVIKKSNSCGCVRKEYKMSEEHKNLLKELSFQRGEDLVGKRFSRLIVLEYASEDKQKYYNGQHRRTWKCQCDCGNICYATTENLKRGDTPSCGCITKENARKRLNDLTGQRFGHLEVIKYIGTINHNSKYWVKCDCGKEYEIYSSNLTRKNPVTSCGCVRESHGENKIREILIKNNIDFIAQKRFNDFKFEDTNGIPKYDFYLPKFNTCIEYDGEQHFKCVYNFDTEEKFQLRLKHDIEKNQYCFNHNITIIRIPYTEYSKFDINDLLPETSKFIVRKE